MKIYKLEVDMAIECNQEDMEDLRDEITYSIIEACEAYDAYIGGSLHLKECIEQDDEDLEC